MLFFTYMNFQLIVLFLLIFNFSHLDVAENWISTSQDPAIPVMEGIINFHNHIMTFFNSYRCICCMVYVPCYRFIRRKSETPLEVVWTIVPAIVLVVLSFILIESPAECMEGDPSASSYTSSSRLPPRVPHYHAIDDFLTQYGRELPESSLPPEPIPAQRQF